MSNPEIAIKGYSRYEYSIFMFCERIHMAKTGASDAIALEEVARMQAALVSRLDNWNLAKPSERDYDDAVRLLIKAAVADADEIVKRERAFGRLPKLPDVRIFSVAEDFSRFPAGITTADSPYSGDRLAQELTTLLDLGHSVRVLMDGVAGYGSSFLEAAFGGLVRYSGLSVDELRQRVVVESRDTSIVREVWQYIERAGEEGDQ